MSDVRLLSAVCAYLDEMDAHLVMIVRADGALHVNGRTGYGTFARDFPVDQFGFADDTLARKRLIAMLDEISAEKRDGGSVMLIDGSFTWHVLLDSGDVTIRRWQACQWRSIIEVGTP